MSRKFSVEELSNYNGLRGKPAYIGYKGKVYDVSGLFKDGEHAGVKAGIDISDSFGKGPHQEDIFDKFPVVGSLVFETGPLAKIFRSSSQQADLILRLALGIVFFAHGAQKLLGWFGGYGWDGTVGFFTQALGVPAPLAGLAILTEFFGGIAIILGLLTRPAALGLAVTMLVAAFKVHLANGFFLDQQGPADGIEYAFVLLLLSLYFTVKGAGTVSADKFIFDKLAGKTNKTS
jgi:putative oxidoreductase